MRAVVGLAAAAAATAPGPDWCGDGQKAAAGEQCDDGNLVPGDGCSGSCRLEPGWVCTEEGGGTLQRTGGGTSRCSPICGDSVIVSSQTVAEQCDDGNSAAGDGCSADCHVESGSWCDLTVAPSQCYSLGYTISPASPRAGDSVNVTLVGRGVHPVTKAAVTLTSHPEWQVQLASGGSCSGAAAAGTEVVVLPAGTGMTATFAPAAAADGVGVCLRPGAGAALTPVAGAPFSIAAEVPSFVVEGPRMALEPLRLRVDSATLRGLQSVAALRVGLSQRFDCASLDALGTTVAAVSQALTVSFAPRVDGDVVPCLSENAGAGWRPFGSRLIVLPRIEAALTLAAVRVHSVNTLRLTVANQGSRAVAVSAVVIVSDLLKNPATAVPSAVWAGRGATDHQPEVCASEGIARLRCNATVPALTSWPLAVRFDLVPAVPVNVSAVVAEAEVDVPEAAVTRRIEESAALVRPQMRIGLRGSTERPLLCSGADEAACRREPAQCAWSDGGWRTGDCRAAVLWYRLLVDLAESVPESAVDDVRLSLSVRPQSSDGTAALPVFQETASQTGALSCAMFADGSGTCSMPRLQHGTPRNATLVYSLPEDFGGVVSATAQAWALLAPSERTEAVTELTPVSGGASTSGAAAAPLFIPSLDSGGDDKVLGLPVWAWAVLAGCLLVCCVALCCVLAAVCRKEPDDDDSSSEESDTVIRVATDSGVLLLSVTPDTTVDEVKAAVEAATGVAASRQHVHTTLHPAELPGSATLRACGVLSCKELEIRAEEEEESESSSSSGSSRTKTSSGRPGLVLSVRSLPQSAVS